MRDQSQPQVWTIRTYDRLAKYYDLLMKLSFPMGEKGREKIVERLDSGSVLDVACGTGTLLALAYQKGLECSGIDNSPEMLKQAQVKVPSAELKRASYYELPYQDEQFEYVVATNALSGTQIDAKRVISEMARVCKSGGRVYLAEWPRAVRETLLERFMVWLASLNEDAPKDYQAIFADLGYESEEEVLGKRYSIFSIQKR